MWQLTSCEKFKDLDPTFSSCTANIIRIRVGTFTVVTEIGLEFTIASVTAGGSLIVAS